MPRSVRLLVLVSALALVACRSDRSDRLSSRLAAPEDSGTAAREELDALRERWVTVTECDLAVTRQRQVDALVLDVTPSSGVVVLDRGRSAGVEVGYLFDVYRGTTYKGQVRIHELREATSVGTVTFATHAIEAGDSATTCL